LTSADSFPSKKLNKIYFKVVVFHMIYVRGSPGLTAVSHKVNFISIRPLEVWYHNIIHVMYIDNHVLIYKKMNRLQTLPLYSFIHRSM